MQIDIQVPPKLLPIFHTDKRFIVARGGRGSGKSWTFADFLIYKTLTEKKRVLCTREIQKSIKDSVHKLLTDRINYHKLSKYYHITEKGIKGPHGSEFIFKGMRHNPDEIKSTEGLDYAWIEEGQNTSRKSLDILVPTIRKESSQILVSYNPTDEEDPVHEDYTLTDREDVLNIEVNYSDNPMFPKVLKRDMEYDKRVDYDKYLHVWQGQCIVHSDAQVFYGKWEIDDFEAPEGSFFYLGADWGFSKDPSTLIRCFVLDNKLYIDYEFYEVGVDIDHLPERFKSIPDAEKYPIIADSARPDTINYMRRYGFPLIKGAKKGAGSIEEGVAFLRSFEKIIIHPRCKHTITEFRTYKYVVDPHTGAISKKLEDKNNHIIDALRYATEDLQKHRQARVTQTVGW